MFQPNQNYNRPPMPPQMHHQQPFPQHQPTHMNNFMHQPQQMHHPNPGGPRPQFPGHNMQIGHQPFGYKPNKPSFFKSAFTNEEGKFDMNKTVSTVDQVVKTVHQATPIMKTLGGFFIKK